MEHQSLYRKYRSQAFDELVGQQHVTRTLQNALSSDRVAHAYLFCGPRGTGKTSTARLLAKALNCENGPTSTPCGECDLCLSIASRRVMDVVEVDAASETGIDNVREVIINNSRYAPAEGRYKVYIIDEVHDLSRAAFDGLLKTLEEPPPHVVFVLATTEIHKVPATIISRCQRFEFRRGSLEEVRSRVEYVAEQEGVSIEPAAATLIARAAEGGWRDALSLLEQVIAFAGRSIAARDVGLVLGTIEDESLAELARQIVERDSLGTLRTLDGLLSDGKDIRQLLHSFSDYVRDCLLLAMGGAPDIARTLTPLTVERGMDLLELTARAERELRWNTQHRLVLELMLLRMTAAAAVLPHARVGEKTASSIDSTRSAAPQILPSGDNHPARERVSPGPHSLQSPPTTPSERPANAGISMTSEAVRPAPVDRDSTPVVEDQDWGPTVPDPITASAGATADTAETAGTTGAESSADDGIDLAAVQARWKVLLGRVRTNSRRLATLLEAAAPVGYIAGVLNLEFKQEYHHHGIEEVSARRAIESILAEVMGRPIRITCTLNQQEQPGPRGKSGRKEVQPVTDHDLGELFPGWEIHES